MAYFLSPVLNEQLFDANGNPLAGGQIFTYLAGTVTPVTTFKTSTGTAHTNPIVLDSSGNYPTGTQLWLEGGKTYKFVIQNSVGVTLRTIDNITPTNDIASLNEEWTQYAATTFAYISPTSFSVSGDQTLVFQQYRRVKAVTSGGTVYGRIVSSIYSVPNTVVTLELDSGTLDSGLSAVYYGILAAQNISIPFVSAAVLRSPGTGLLGGNGGDALQTLPFGNAAAFTALWRPTETVASAANISLIANPLSNTANIVISGTTTITSFTMSEGRIYFVKFSGALTLTNNANIITGTGANITTAANDTCVVRGLAGGVVEILLYTTSAQKIVYGTPQATTTGTTFDFTAGTSGRTRRTVYLTGVSLSGTDNLQFQFLVGGVAQTGSYSGYVTRVGAASSSYTAFGTGAIVTDGAAAANTYSGKVVFELADSATNTWSITGSLTATNAANNGLFFTGTRVLSGAPNGVRMLATGANTFDGGSANDSAE